MDFDNKKLKLRREWLPDAEQLIEKSEKVDPKMELLAPPPMINGKMFIWSEQDHKEVKMAYEGKKIEERESGKKFYHDAIQDTIEETDWDAVPMGPTQKEIETRKAYRELAAMLEQGLNVKYEDL